MPDASTTVQMAQHIDFRADGEAAEYMKKLVIPVVIVTLLVTLIVYAIWTYGISFFIPRLLASSFLIAGMMIGAIAILIIIKLYTRWMFLNQVVSRSIMVTETNLPNIHRIVMKAADRLAMTPAGVYVAQDPQINAYALGVFRKIIVLNTGLIDVAGEEELIFIIGHELSHVKYGWSVPVKMLGITLPLPLLFSSQRREYTCDRGGLLASRSLNASVMVLAKLAVGKRLADMIDIDRLYRDRKDVQRDRISRLTEFIASHPPIRDRVYQLRQYYESGQYRELTQ
ncbi:MAG TPA: M48 family metallopeptidase [Methanocella sp.]|nr:M48 family metallopeptidase [Methanocella sp.]